MLTNLSSKDHYFKTWKLAYPVCLSQLGHMMVGVVDTAMVGLIGTEAQAAIALVNSLFYLLLMFGIGYSMGITPLVAAADSKGNVEESARLLFNGFFANLLIGIFLFVVMWLTIPQLNHFGQPQNVVNMAIPFLGVITLSLIPLAIFSHFKQFAEGMSDTKAAMYISIVANLLNIVLNYVFIFGKLGVPAMGFMGSCWASFIARVCMALSMFLYVRFHSRFKIYWSYFSMNYFSFSHMRHLTAIGVPVGLQFVFEIGAFSVAAIMVGWIGATEMAAHQIALSMAAITYMIASGLGAATTVRVGNYFGVKNFAALRMAGLASYRIVFVFMGCCAIVFFLMNHYLPMLFTRDLQVLSIAAQLILFAALFQLSDGTQVVGLGALRGLEDTKIPTAITLFSYWMLSLPLCYYLGFVQHLGVYGIWLGLTIGLTSAAVLLYWRFNYLSKRKTNK